MAVNAANTKSSLDALFKDVYGDKLQNLKPDFGILIKEISFRESKKTGRDFVEPVALTHEHGFTYGQGLVTLNDIIVAENDDAKVRGNSLTLRTAFSYDAAANMSGDKGSFVRGTEYKFKTMMESATYRLEAQMLYGGSGLGSVKTSAANDTDDTIDFTDASWAPGIWAGSENAAIDVYDVTLTTLRGSYFIDSVNTDSKLINVASAATMQADGVVAGDVVFFKSAKGNEMVGLRSIVSNTGTLYGINAASYSLWQGNSSAVGSTNLTLKKIYQGINKAVGKGLMEDVDVLVSPATFATLANDEAALRRYSAASKASNGFESIEFHGPNGKISIKVHPMVKEGEAIAYPKGKAERIGATDITFKTPGKGDEMFQQISDQTGYECRLYSEQALWLPCPAKCVLFTGITNA